VGLSGIRIVKEGDILLEMRWITLNWGQSKEHNKVGEKCRKSGGGKHIFSFERRKYRSVGSVSSVSSIGSGLKTGRKAVRWFVGSISSGKGRLPRFARNDDKYDSFGSG